MQIEEFLRRVSEEPERAVIRETLTAPPELLTKASKPHGMLLTDFLSAPGRRAERRETTYRHILGAPASLQAVDAWHEQRPSHTLPADLVALVRQVNGIHLWANVATGLAYTGIAPIEQWDLARIKMYGSTASRDLLDDRYVAISYHQDGASFIVLDVASGRYFLMDVAGPDATSLIAGNVHELLDYVWDSRISPEEPRFQRS